jgi:hypothetical protein
VRKNPTRAFLFPLSVGIMIAFLIVLNWLPKTFQHDTLRSYSSIEEAKESLRLKKVYVPAFFPQPLTWPPDTIIGQNKPFPAVLMEFRRKGEKEPALLITQTTREQFNNNLPIQILKITQQVPYDLEGRQATLTVGTCKAGEQCSSLSWGDDAYIITVSMKAPPFDLIKIAHSMLY